MQFLRKPFHALCMCRDYCFRGRMIGIPTLHSGIWTWELRTPDRLQACSPRSPLCLTFMTWKTDLRLQWIFLSPPNINHIISDNIICGRDGLGEGRLAMATSGRWKFAFLLAQESWLAKKMKNFISTAQVMEVITKFPFANKENNRSDKNNEFSKWQVKNMLVNIPSPPLPFQRTASMNKEGQRSRKVSSSSLK